MHGGLTANGAFSGSWRTYQPGPRDGGRLQWASALSEFDPGLVLTLGVVASAVWVLALAKALDRALSRRQPSSVALPAPSRQRRRGADLRPLP